MKILIGILFLFVGTIVYGNDCGTFFEKGSIEMATATNKSDAATADFTAALSTDDEDPDNHPFICRRVFSAIKLYDEAADYYLRSYKNFKFAQETCTDERAEKAKENAKTTFEKAGHAGALSNEIANNLPEYCG